MSLKTIGILTGGGDCPGLNPAIKAVTRKASIEGFKIMGIRDGWKGLMEGLFMELDEEKVRTIDRQGGTILGTTRTNPFKTPEGHQKVLDTFGALGLHALITIGGEDTLGVARRLHKEFSFPVVGIPKTIDRDLGGTEYSLGFESALQVITDAIDSLRSTAGSHSRIFVVETMGRHTGTLALKGGMSGGANIILIPEYPFNVDEVCKLLHQRKLRGYRYSIVVVAEGAKPKDVGRIVESDKKDEFGHVRLGGIAKWLSDRIEEKTGLETRYVILSHLQRGGKPVSYDRRIGYYFGTAAVEAVQGGRFGMMVAMKEGRVTLLPFEDVLASLKYIDVQRDYDTERYNYKLQILHIGE
jgi:6-phosphofructokinase 1